MTKYETYACLLRYIKSLALTSEQITKYNIRTCISLFRTPRGWVTQFCKYSMPSWVEIIRPQTTISSKKWITVYMIPQNNFSVAFHSINNNFSTRKLVWKCRLQNGSHFVTAPIWYNHWIAHFEINDTSLWLHCIITFTPMLSVKWRIMDEVGRWTVYAFSTMLFWFSFPGLWK